MAPLRVCKTIGSSAGTPLDFLIAAALQVAIWGGGMVVGPVLTLGAPVAFFVLPRFSLGLWVGLTAVLAFMPRLPESPMFCRLYLRVACLLKNGSSLWIADEVLPHVGDGAMVCYHPHGVLPFGFTLNGAIRAKTRQPKRYLSEEALISHRVSGVQAPILFRIPILRQILHLFGCTVPATKKGMFGLFSKRMTFGIIPGGSEEVALHIKGRERIYIRSRAGFLKYALQFGFKVIIAYNFGESDLYENVSVLQAWNMWLVKRLGFVLPLFWGRWWCPLLPRGDVELHTVFGRVLELPQIDNPTAEQVAEWHQRYITELVAVFDDHKAQFGFGDRKLEIF